MSTLQELLDFLRSRKKVTLCMVFISVAAFLVLSLLGDTESGMFMLQHGAAYTPYIMNGEYWRLITGMFLHFGLPHLLYNMLCLIFLGDMLEKRVGSLRFLIIYLLGGIGGNLLSLAMDLRTDQPVISAGASGAIFAVIGAFLYVSLRNRSRASELQLKRLLFMTILMVGEGFTQTGVDNAAHVGGLITGFVLCVLLYHPRKSK